MGGRLGAMAASGKLVLVMPFGEVGECRVRLVLVDKAE